MINYKSKKKHLKFAKKNACLLVMRQDKMLLPRVGERCVASITTSANTARGHLAALLEKDEIMLL